LHWERGQGVTCIIIAGRKRPVLKTKEAKKRKIQGRTNPGEKRAKDGMGGGGEKRWRS